MAGNMFERVGQDTTVQQQGNPNLGAEVYGQQTPPPWRANYNQVAPVYTDNVPQNNGQTQPGVDSTYSTGGYDPNQNPGSFDQTQQAPPPVRDVNNPNGVPLNQINPGDQTQYGPQQQQQRQGGMNNGGIPYVDPRNADNYTPTHHSDGVSLPLTLVVGGVGGALGANTIPRLLHSGADSILKTSAEGGSTLTRFNFLDSVDKIVPDKLRPQFDSLKAKIGGTAGDATATAADATKVAATDGLVAEGTAAQAATKTGSLEQAAQFVKTKIGMPTVAETAAGAETAADGAKSASMLSKFTEGPMLKNAAKGALFAGAVYEGSHLVDSMLGGNTMFRPTWQDAALMGTTFMMPIADTKLKVGLLAGEYAFGRLQNMDTGHSLIATGLGAAATVGLTRGNPRLMAGLLAAEGGAWVLSRVFHNDA